MKNLLKSIAVAFSLYSKIPMPRFNWGTEDMKYHLIFFPWVGAVIALLEILVTKAFYRGVFIISETPYHCLSLAIPLIVTGGFHLDGFMDTMDALHSYQSREKKLEILKDPHIGAFSVISLVVYMLLAYGASSLVYKFNHVTIVGFSFFISRCLSGISVTCFPKAKKDGMAATESQTAGKKLTFWALVFELVVSVALMLYLTLSSGLHGLFSLGGMALAFIYYYFMSKRQFGGITGDLSGFFVCISELASLIGVVLCSMIFYVPCVA